MADALLFAASIVGGAPQSAYRIRPQSVAAAGAVVVASRVHLAEDVGQNVIFSQLGPNVGFLIGRSIAEQPFNVRLLVGGCVDVAQALFALRFGRLVAARAARRLGLAVAAAVVVLIVENLTAVIDVAGAVCK